MSVGWSCFLPVTRVSHVLVINKPGKLLYACCVDIKDKIFKYFC